ncbi:MAG: hypothetical protein MK207_15870 [Saprospiraceae bacterium]|nr:hypothetical protein [Saprospiraceae bacterium]
MFIIALLFLFLSALGAGSTRFGPPDSAFSLVAAVLIAPFWGLILWRYSYKRKKKMMVKTSPFDDVLDAD